MHNDEDDERKSEKLHSPVAEERRSLEQNTAAFRISPPTHSSTFEVQDYGTDRTTWKAAAAGVRLNGRERTPGVGSGQCATATQVRRNAHTTLGLVRVVGRGL